MSSQSPQILALDFDGVICNGLIEYFQSSKRTYQQIWQEEPASDLEELAESFYQLRPVVEVGWEMPLLLRALVMRIPRERIVRDWPNVTQEILRDSHLEKQDVMEKLDAIRDSWLTSNLDAWLELHRFYPGVIQRLQQILTSPTELYIITTKEGRFVKKLLQRQGLELAGGAIIGKEIGRPKYETLRELLKISSAPPQELWFVEDLLKTLHSVQQKEDLQGVKLYLASWGYNTQETRDSTAGDSQVRLLSLKEFNQDFSHWP